jgi:hypothetical protein
MDHDAQDYDSLRSQYERLKTELRGHPPVRLSSRWLRLRTDQELKDFIHFWRLSATLFECRRDAERATRAQGDLYNRDRIKGYK